MEKYYGVNIQKQRELLLKSKAAEGIIEEVITKADNAIGKSYEALKISEYMLFYKTGDRATFEKKHMERRYDALDLAAALWLTDNEKYLEPLEDVIFNILDEFTWCVAAHTSHYTGDKTPEWYREEVDLFNARTAILLCDIYTITKDKLSLLTKRRIAEEIRRRIIEPIKEKSFVWEKSNNNWLSYCVTGMSLSTALFGTNEEFQKLLPRFVGICDRYLGGFGEDCCCLEGGSYWTAFSEFLRTAIVIKDASDGKIRLLEDERVEKIAAFQTKILMNPEKIVAFSDSKSSFSFRPGCISFLNKLYPHKIHIPDLKYRSPIGSMGLGMIDILWFDVDYAPTPLKPLTTFFHKSEWYIARKKNFCFAAKGGFNKEPHNHNDIGSFMASSPDGKIPFGELGTGLYTRQYFEDDKRYTILNNGSQGHSVPIINGEYQQFGMDFCAKNTTAGDCFFETDMAGAYTQGIIEKAVRRFDISENGFTMKDTFLFSDKTETFIERILVSDNPIVSDGEIVLDGAKLTFDYQKYTAKVITIPYFHHTGEQKTATFIDFEPKNKSERVFEMKAIF